MENKTNKELEGKIVEYLLNLGGNKIFITKSFPNYFANKHGCRSGEVSRALENLSRTDTEIYSLERLSL